MALVVIEEAQQNVFTGETSLLCEHCMVLSHVGGGLITVSEVQFIIIMTEHIVCRKTGAEENSCILQATGS